MAEEKIPSSSNRNQVIFKDDLFYTQDFPRMVQGSLKIEVASDQVASITVDHDGKLDQFVSNGKLASSQKANIYVFKKEFGVGSECIVKIDYTCKEKVSYDAMKDFLAVCPYFVPCLYAVAVEGKICVEIMPKMDNDMFDIWHTDYANQKVPYIAQYYAFLKDVMNCLEPLMQLYSDIKPENIGVKFINGEPYFCLLDIGGLNSEFTYLFPNCLPQDTPHVRECFIWQILLNIMRGITLSQDDVIDNQFKLCFLNSKDPAPIRDFYSEVQLTSLEHQDILLDLIQMAFKIANLDVFDSSMFSATIEYMDKIVPRL